MNSKSFHALTLGAAILLSAQVFSQDQDTLEYREGYDHVLNQRWPEAQEYFQQS